MQFELIDIPAPVVFAAHRIIKDCSHEFSSLFGYERDELIGTGFHLLYPKFADFMRVGEMWHNNMSDQKTYYDERVMQHFDGHKFWCRVKGMTRNEADPFSAAIYYFEPLKRVVEHKKHVLTDRQMQVVALVAQGKKNKEIAKELNRSIRTIEMHRAAALKGVDARNTAQLIAWFEQQKL